MDMFHEYLGNPTHKAMLGTDEIKISCMNLSWKIIRNYSDVQIKFIEISLAICLVRTCCIRVALSSILSSLLFYLFGGNLFLL